jgi:predicted KAP-like P-loop ATPase
MQSTRPPIHVWQDNETENDLLGFDVHADLIRSVITDQSVLPVTVGVFGDWGGGKSSIMKMLQKELSKEEAYPDVVCLYFNGWTFEGYEDAKSALLSSILIQLGEHKKFGPKAKDWIVKLLKRVKWMELGKVAVKTVGVPLAVAAMTGGIGAVPVAAAAVGSAIASSVSGKEKSGDDESTVEVNWSELIEANPEKPDVMSVRKFREEFEKMLAKTGISALIVLIDDLDRCLPERLIETLEAIKLFVAVPKTAFVIGADPRIVRHAISTRYVKRQLEHSVETADARREEEGLVQDYLEKLIQVPYQLPRLSPSEIETYINLLACQKLLDAPLVASVLAAWRNTRALNIYAPFTAEAIQKALPTGSHLPVVLKEQLDWSKAVASVITEGLKGNPRQVKRMLNAMSLRKELAAIAKISIKEEILAKLMVLEYSNLPLFQELNQWQAAEKGVPAKLKKLETEASKDEDASDTPAPDDGLAKWRTPSMRSWLRMQPPLSGADLRDYFWLARDRTGSTLAGVTMVPPNVQVALQKLLNDNNAGEVALGLKLAPGLPAPELALLLDLLKQNAERHPDRLSAVSALYKLSIQKVSGAGAKLIETARSTPPDSLKASVPQNIAEIGQTEPQLRDSAMAALKEIALQNTTKAGKAAGKALESMQKKN